MLLSFSTHPHLPHVLLFILYNRNNFRKCNPMSSIPNPAQQYTSYLSVLWKVHLTHRVLFWSHCWLYPCLALLVTDITFLSLILTQIDICFIFTWGDKQCKEILIWLFWPSQENWDLFLHGYKYKNFALFFSVLLKLWAVRVGCGRQALFLCTNMKILASLNQ